MSTLNQDGNREEGARRTSAFFAPENRRLDTLTFEVLVAYVADGPRGFAARVGVNGHPSQRGYRRLEVLDLNPSPQSKSVFNYHEIEFPDETETAALSWLEAQSRIQISKANPPKCVQCHGQPARPIFQSYPSWEGAFGSRHTSTDPVEMAGLEKFVGFQSQNPKSRYRHLNLQRFSTKAGHHIHPGINDPLYFSSAGQTIRVNTDLSNYNGMRIAKIIRSLPFYNPFRFAIVAVLNDCGPNHEFFTAPVRKALTSNIDSIYGFSETAQNEKTLRQFADLVSSLTTQSFGSLSSLLGPEEKLDKNNGDLKSRLSYHRSYWGNDPILFALSVDTMTKQGRDRMVPETAMLRLIFEGHGVDMSHWWSDLRQATYRSNSGFGMRWGQLMSASDPSLGSYPENATSIERHQYCQNLAALSRQALQDYQVKAIPRRVVEASSAGYPAVFLNTCAKCHVEHEIGPPIPFHDPSGLVKWTQGEDRMKRLLYRIFEAPEGRSMPPTRTLTESEVSQVRRYLETLR